MRCTSVFELIRTAAAGKIRNAADRTDCASDIGNNIINYTVVLIHLIDRRLIDLLYILHIIQRISYFYDLIGNFFQVLGRLCVVTERTQLVFIRLQAIQMCGQTGCKALHCINLLLIYIFTVL